MMKAQREALVVVAIARRCFGRRAKHWAARRRILLEEVALSTFAATHSLLQILEVKEKE